VKPVFFDRVECEHLNQFWIQIQASKSGFEGFGCQKKPQALFLQRKPSTWKCKKKKKKKTQNKDRGFSHEGAEV